MTPLQLKKRIKTLRAKQPITARFERDLAARGQWNSDEEWYETQQEHWCGWLSEYGGPGAYRRKGGSHRDARFAYNHINCPPMLLWLGEAAGISRATVLSAMSAALQGKQAFPSQCRAIRLVIPWAIVEQSLKHKATDQ